MLKQKQSMDNSEWLKVFINIHNIVSKKEIDNLIDHTLEDIKRKTKGKDTVYGWSGGKDSIVLSFLAKQAGIHEGVCVICNLEYPKFLEWILANKPQGIEIINTGQDLDWLAKNQHMLFPNNEGASRWFSIVQHRGQRIYMQKHKAEIIMLGRRKADGNNTGKGTNMYAGKDGFIRFNPLADWRHEDILAVIHYYELNLPPIYSWPNGFKCGTHPWPARQHTKSIWDGWRQIYQIDPSIVEMASTKIDSAKQFLKGVLS